MFENTFAAELASRVGSRVEIATDNNLVEGILSTVTPGSILLINADGGYGQTNRRFFGIDAVNFVRFPLPT